MQAFPATGNAQKNRKNQKKNQKKKETDVPRCTWVFPAKGNNQNIKK